jgi:metacaspase-1
LKDPSVVLGAAKGLLTAGQAYARGDVNGLVSAGMALFNRVTRSKEQRERTRVLKTSSADVIQFSGCKDDQKSADTTEAVSTLPPFPYS